MKIRDIVENKSEVIEKVSMKGFELSKEINELEKLFLESNALISSIDNRNKEINELSNIVKKNPDKKEEVIKKVKDIKNIIEKENQELREIKESSETIWFKIPNIPDDSVPFGENEKDNELVFESDLKKITHNNPHWDILSSKEMVDFDRAVKLSGSRFVIYKNSGSQLMEAVKTLMLDTHSNINGYEPYSTPFLVKSDILLGTGQLPKYADDLFSTQNDLWLIPTAEVSLTNIFNNEIVKQERLPIKMTGYTPSFRKEAGSAGKDNKGLIRLHQFNKVELVHILNPKDDKKELINMLDSAKMILELLEIPYRIVKLCTKEMTFTSSITYDIEVWMPSKNDYVEISSISSCSDFQSTRMNLFSVFIFHS